MKAMLFPDLIVCFICRDFNFYYHYSFSQEGAVRSYQLHPLSEAMQPSTRLSSQCELADAHTYICTQLKPCMLEVEEREMSCRISCFPNSFHPLQSLHVLFCRPLQIPETVYWDFLQAIFILLTYSLHSAQTLAFMLLLPIILAQWTNRCTMHVPKQSWGCNAFTSFW